MQKLGSETKSKLFQDIKFMLQGSNEEIKIVEGIFTIWLDTLKKPVKDSWTVTMTGYNLAKSIREEVDLIDGALRHLRYRA